MKFSFWWIFLVVVLVLVLCLENRVECAKNKGSSKKAKKEERLKANELEEFDILVRVYLSDCTEEHTPNEDKRTCDLVLVCEARTNLSIFLEEEYNKKKRRGLKRAIYADAAYLVLMQETILNHIFVHEEKSIFYAKALSHHLRMSPEEIDEANENTNIYERFAVILEVVIKDDRFEKLREEFLREVRGQILVIHAEHNVNSTALNVWSIFGIATFLENEDYVRRFKIYKQKQIEPNPKQLEQDVTGVGNGFIRFFCMRPPLPPPPSMKNEPPIEPTLRLTDAVRYWLDDILRHEKNVLTRDRVDDFDILYAQIKRDMDYWKEVPITDDQIRTIIQNLYKTTKLFEKSPDRIIAWTRELIPGEYRQWDEDQIHQLRVCIQMSALLMRTKFPVDQRGKDQLEVLLALIILLQQKLRAAQEMFPNTGFGKCREVFEPYLDEMISNRDATSQRGTGGRVDDKAEALRRLREHYISAKQEMGILKAAEPFLYRYEHEYVPDMIGRMYQS